jgi:CheY-like chemotaxis protein
MPGDSNVNGSGLRVPPEPPATAGADPPLLEQLKTQFLASLNHEIRTPLSGIIGMTDLLGETEMTAEQQGYVSTVRSCADHLLGLLNATLEYAALTAGTLVLDDYEFNLAETLELAVTEHAPKACQKELSLTFTYDDSLPQAVMGDARRLRQMVSQLVANAVKFTLSGHVRVRAVQPVRGELLVTVEDTGIGIEPVKMDAIFESFRQLETGLARNYPGLGLGLPLARRISKLLGGEVTVESTPGAGSIFKVRLPLRTQVAGVSDASPRPETPDPVKSILVVEDNRVAQTVISHVLRRNGFLVKCVGTGAEGVDAASRERFDLILMDLQMPVMDGVEATERVRKLPEYATVPILALTASDSDQCRELCERKGMQGFLSKPVQPRELIANVRRFV